jgi:FkbH-like protein
MVATISYFNAAGRARIAHLINTTDQFNLTTRRYSERDIEQLEVAPGKFCIRISLADRFGDNGLISVLIFDRGAKEWRCDTWLMSSRALGRRVEELALATVAQAASGAGASRLSGVYLPTAKNALVADHYAKLGFTKRSDLKGGGTQWVLDLATYRAPSLPIAIIRTNGLSNHTTA